MADIMHFSCDRVKCFSRKEESKCARIFRPWDADDDNQDATISTTTDIEETETEPKPKPQPTIEPIKDIPKTKDSPAKKNFHRPLKSTKETTKNLPQEDPVPYSPTLDSSHLYPPDLFQAHSMGFPVPDPVFLESLSGACTFEEYSRFLSQEHQAKLLSARKQRPKKYKCPHCDVGFSNNGQLKGHIRIHTGERPFKCDDKNCGKTFTRNEELTRHKRIHSGLRPFPCTHCGKRFGRKDHLKKHSRTHFQPRGMYAVPVMLPFEAAAWGAATTTPGYPYVPMFGY